MLRNGQTRSRCAPRRELQVQPHTPKSPLPQPARCDASRGIPINLTALSFRVLLPAVKV